MHKTYACSDLHGLYPLWEQIKDYCDETDTIYFLGDAIDRGPDGIKILLEMLYDPRIIFLKGNHESFLEESGEELLEDHYPFSIRLWEQNGGWKSIDDFSKLDKRVGKWLFKKIKALPLTAEYVNKKGQKILLSHAGYHPMCDPKERDYLWDREHIYLPWSDSEEYKETYVIHGHTPVQSLIFKAGFQRVKPELDDEGSYDPLVYADGHKIDIDVGSFFSGKAVLFDLDELKVAARFYNEEQKRRVW